VRRAPRPLAAAVGCLTASLAPATALGRLQEVWESAAGPVVAEAARPIAERAGVVTLACASAVWAQELSLLETTLRQRLNEALGEPLVQALRCRVA
jgi:predicted nucleic acid-binding Zn ribbon protein